MPRCEKGFGARYPGRASVDLELGNEEVTQPRGRMDRLPLFLLEVEWNWFMRHSGPDLASCIRRYPRLLMPPSTAAFST